MAIDPSRIYSALMNTGLQQKDNPLYQVIRDLIGNLVLVSKQSSIVTSITSDIDQDAFIPYHIGPTEIFTVPINKQGLFAMNIDNEGSLVVDGFLIEVD